ncbi:MAG: nicotinate-nucleotide adenylyltransferase [Eubacteriales bacterium]
MKKKIGVFGGTFDPVHYGHLIFAEQVRSLCGLDKIIFVPAKLPPHKLNDLLTNIKYRFDMVNMAISSNPNFEISDIEMLSDDVSYTYNTLASLKTKLGEDFDLYFIVGADAWLDLEDWFNSEGLLRKFSFIIGDRPGYKENLVNEKIQDIYKRYKTNILKIDIPEIEISSSEIRAFVKKGRSIKYLIPEEVEKFINSKNLYKENCNGNELEI